MPGPELRELRYLICQIVVVLLTSFDTIRSALPVGLWSAGTNVRPSGPRSPQSLASLHARNAPVSGCAGACGWWHT